MTIEEINEQIKEALQAQAEAERVTALANI